MSSENTKDTRSQNRSRKRKYTQGKNPANKRRKLDYEVDLSKERNIILCSTERMKEVMCGKDLQLVFSEYINELLLKKKEQENSDKNNDDKLINTATTTTDDDKINDKTDKPITTAITTTNDDQIDNDNNDNDNQDDDLKVNKLNTNNNKKANNDNNKNDDNNDNKDNNDNDDNNEDDDLNVNNNNNISIADAIKNELASFNSNKVCEWIKGPPGLVVIDIKETNVSASDLLEYTFDKFHPKRPNLSPFVFNLYPLDCTSFSRQDDMINLAKKMIDNMDWNKISNDDPYAIDYKNRGNKSLNRTEIIKGIAECMPNDYKVNLDNPKTVILLQTFGRTSGVSIITNGAYAKHRKYNLSSFAD